MAREPSMYAIVPLNIKGSFINGFTQKGGGVGLIIGEAHKAKRVTEWGGRQ